MYGRSGLLAPYTNTPGEEDMLPSQDHMGTAFEKEVKEQGLWEAGFATWREKGVVSWLLWEGVFSFSV